MKLELKHLAEYLPYGLEFKGKRKGWVFIDSGIKTLCYVDFDGRWEIIKPILRPLSEFGDSDDLRKVHEFIGLGNWCEAYDQYFKAWFDDACSIHRLILQAPKEIFNYFLSKHFDVYGLIEKDLAIDINTLDKK